ncbi:endonuclease [Fibrobacteres bacterium R8-0-B4]
MKFWHMQLHRGNQSKFTIDVIKKIITDKSVIGLGDPEEDPEHPWQSGFGQLKNFKEVMDIGDIVAVRQGGTPIALVEVTGDWEPVDPAERNEDFDWFYFKRGIKIIDFYKGSGTFKCRLKTLLPCNKDDAETTRFIKKWYQEVSGKKPKGDVVDKVDRLKESKNIIFNGAPGTGKTYLAKQIALRLIFPESDKDNVDKLNEEERKKYDVQCRFVQFHPSYDYTDFVEGLRPTRSNSGQNIGFELKDGIFMEFCKAAAMDDEKNPYVFIIDEINRGEISKIFGELFFSIDPDYRGVKGMVQTQYSNMRTDGKDKSFYVPDNVYIIGTMNDIDRSVESFDFAMRRRFTFIEITAKESAVNMDISLLSKERMDRLNERIEGIEGLNSSYHIGASYFKKYEDGGIVDYNDLWKYHIEPLLKEYLRGMPDSDKTLKDLKDSYNLKNSSNE